MPRVPTTLITLGQPVKGGEFLRRQGVLSPHRFVYSEIMDPLGEGAAEEGKIVVDGPI